MVGGKLNRAAFPQTWRLATFIWLIAIVLAIVTAGAISGSFTMMGAMAYAMQSSASLPIVILGAVAGYRLVTRKSDAPMLSKCFAWMLLAASAWDVFLLVTQYDVWQLTAFRSMILVSAAAMLLMLYKSAEIKAVFPSSFRSYGKMDIAAVVGTAVLSLLMPFIIGLAII